MDPDKLKQYCKENNCEFTSNVIEDEKLKALVYESFMKLHAKNKLNSLEKPK